MFTEKVLSEYTSIKGRRISYNGAGLYVENLIDRDGVPTVILSDDTEISLMEAVNSEIYVEKEITNTRSQETFFPDVRYDENGIPILNSPDIQLVNEDIMHTEKPTSKNQNESPLSLLINSAKKTEKEILIKIKISCIDKDLYNVLKNSFPDKDIDNMIVSNISGSISAEDIIKENLEKILG